ncbi:PDZ domain-containing protein, partial [Streptomyces sp. NPDC059696]|uniref:PDZ domain-containing protein n=1 Tax=Streptomyces sp. NPDC059696 TaxID=3346911 RepID=UPI003690D953
MEQTALRPKPMPGQDPEGCAPATGPGPSRPRPHAARRRGRRILNVLLAGFTGVVLVLCGIGVGVMGTAVLGKGGRFDPRGWPHTPSPAGPTPAPAPAPAPSASATATLGVQVMDGRKPGAVVVGLHVPGPAQAAGLIRGDVLLAFGATRIDTAADLVRAVARVRPGAEVRLTVRHRGGGYEQLTLVPAVAA